MVPSTVDLSIVAGCNHAVVIQGNLESRLNKAFVAQYRGPNILFSALIVTSHLLIHLPSLIVFDGMESYSEFAMCFDAFLFLAILLGLSLVVVKVLFFSTRAGMTLSLLLNLSNCFWRFKQRVSKDAVSVCN